MMPAPLVAHPEDGDLTWWEVNPMARVAPAPLGDTSTPEVADFASKSISELKQFLKQRKVAQSELESCVEKNDLIDLCRKSAGADATIRLQRFRAIGNLCGLCVLHDNLNLKLPLFFCRHVYKFLLGRKITFADFAFFDSEAYKVLFDLVKSAADMAPDEELGFDWDSAGIEGPSGDLPVVAKQVHAFVLRKVKFEMVDKVQEELKALKRGVYDVVSCEDLKGLTADDLQLLLSGKAEPVSCEQLRSISTFEDARGNALRSAEPEQLARFETLFWETVEAMDESERLKLVGMATGSLVAPPKLTIKLTECTNSAQAAYAQACIHELHVPDYRDEQGSCINAAELKDVLLRTADMASVLGIDTL